jgi:hypothetical protein
MKYFKLFENFKKYKGTILYHGTSQPHEIKDGHFFSSDEIFALDYGDIIYKGELLTDNIFDSTITDNIKLLYKEGYYLTDDYIVDMNDEEIYPTFNYETERFETAEDFINSEHFHSDTWETIEHSHGVMDFIASRYDGCLILEGGHVNYYIFEPEKYVKILDVYTKDEKISEENPDIRFEDRIRKKNMWD